MRLQGSNSSGPSPLASVWRVAAAALLIGCLAGPLRAGDETGAALGPDQRLGEAWRWRQVQQHPGPNMLRTIRPGPDGQLFASDGHDLFLFDGWHWTTSTIGMDDSWTLRRALPLDDGWLLSTRYSLNAWSPTRNTTRLHTTRDPTSHTRPVRDAEGRIVVGIDGRLEFVDSAGRTPFVGGPDGGGLLLELAADIDGQLIAVTEGGLYGLDGESWSRLDDPRDWPDEPGIRHVVESGQRLYLFSRWLDDERPGLVWDGSSLRRLPPPPVGILELIEDVAAGPDGTLVLATRHGRLLLFQDGQWRPARPASPVDREYIASTCFVDDRLLVLTGSGRLFACDLTSRRWRVYGGVNPESERSMINALAALPDGRVWVAAEEGVGLWSGHDWSEFHETAGPGGIPLVGVTTVCVDADGHLWMGSGSMFEGALEYDGATWTHHGPEAGFEGLCVHRIVRGPEDELWFAMLKDASDDDGPGGGLLRRQGGEWTGYDTSDGLPHARSYDVAFTADGTAWVGTLKGLARRDGERWITVDEPGAPHHRIFSLFVDSRGRIFAGQGLSEAGVAVRDLRGRWRTLSPPRHSHPTAAAFAEDSRGHVFFCGDSGLFRVDEFQAVEFTAPHASPVSNFWPMIADGRGGLWLGSRGNGMVHFEADDHRPPRIEKWSPVSLPSDGSVMTDWTGADFWNVTLERDLRSEIRVDGGPWEPHEQGKNRLMRTPLPGPHTVELRLSDECCNTSEIAAGVVTVPDLLAVRQSLAVSGLFLLMAVTVLSGSAWLRARDRRREREQLEALTLRLMNSQEEERRSLSRDLHDDLGQLLTAATLELQLCERIEDPGGRAQARDRALATVRAALERTRQFSAVLRPRLLDELGLEQALFSAFGEFQERTGVEIRARLDLEGKRLPEPLAGHLYRIVQEALTNAARHAAAKHIDVSMWIEEAHLELAFEDDGQGFDSQRRPSKGGQGLAIMAERIKQVGGKLGVESRPGKGTRIRLSVPAPFAR